MLFTSLIVCALGINNQIFGAHAVARVGFLYLKLTAYICTRIQTQFKSCLVPQTHTKVCCSSHEMGHLDLLTPRCHFWCPSFPSSAQALIGIMYALPSTNYHPFQTGMLDGLGSSDAVRNEVMREASVRRPSRGAAGQCDGRSLYFHYYYYHYYCYYY